MHTFRIELQSQKFPFIRIQLSEQQGNPGRTTLAPQVSVCNIVQTEFKGAKVCDESFNWSR